MVSKQIEDLIPKYLVDSSLFYTVVIDMDGNYSYVNDFFRNKFKFITSNFLGKPSFIAVYEGDHEICTRAVERCFSNPTTPVNIDLRKPDESQQSFYWTSWQFSAFFNSEGEPIGILSIGHDITATEKASKAARNYAQKIDRIVNEISDGFYQLDKKWTIIKANDITKEVFNHHHKDIVGENLWDICPDSPEFLYPEMFKKAMNTHESIVFEEFHSDLQKWFRTTLYPSVEGLTVFFRDVTDVVIDQKKLADSRHKLKAILDSTADVNLLVNREGQIISYNKMAETSLFFSSDHPLNEGDSIYDILNKNHLEHFEDIINNAFNGESLKVDKLIDHNWYQINYYPVLNDSEVINSVAINVRDIDQQKTTQLKLKQQKQLLKAIYNSTTTEAVTFIGPDLTIRYQNSVALELTEKIFGKKARLGDSVLNFVLPELKSEYNNYFKQVLEGGNIEFEQEVDGEWWMINFYPVYDVNQNDSPIGIANNMYNITNRKSYEKQIVSQNDILREIAWQQSHELRKPVANIIGLCDLLKNFPEDDVESHQQFINFLIESSEELDEKIRIIVKQTNSILSKPKNIDFQ